MVKGSKMSRTMRQKLSKAHRGQIPWMKGKHHSEVARQKLSMATKGKNNPMFGRFHSERTKEKLKKARRKRIISEETKRKMSEVLRGKSNPHTEEHKRNISKAMKGKYLREKNPNWKEGISFFPYPPIFNSELKRFIKDRDNNECQNPFCGYQLRNLLNIHHIDYDKDNCSQFNLVTLCVSCNGKANMDRRYWKRLYKKIVWSKYA